MNIHTSISSLVGHTPLLELTGYEKKLGLSAKLYAKVEFFNPAGSVKDRVALEMLSQYEKEGKLTPETTVIEPTSGNTGIGLAALCAAKGIHAVIVMPDSMSRERQLLMTAYGAELVLTDGKLGMQGAIAKAEEMAASIPHAIIAGQFQNPANPEAHYKTTGPEIWQDTDGEADIFVACAGTGGTVSGTARYLKEQNAAIHVVAVEPDNSPYLTRGVAGPHKIQGIGAGFIPKTLDLSLIDEILTVTDDEAYDAVREVAKTDGLLVGISSGAAIAAAAKLANRPENRSKKIVLILPDTGERYLSAGVF